MCTECASCFLGRGGGGGVHMCAQYSSKSTSTDWILLYCSFLHDMLCVLCGRGYMLCELKGAICYVCCVEGGYMLCVLCGRGLFIQTL